MKNPLHTYSEEAIFTNSHTSVQKEGVQITNTCFLRLFTGTLPLDLTHNQSATPLPQLGWGGDTRQCIPT